jgi:hypothetical protein
MSLPQCCGGEWPSSSRAVQDARHCRLRVRLVIDVESAPWATVSLAALRHRLSSDLLNESPGQGANFRVLRRHRREGAGVPLQQMPSLRALDLDVSSQAAQRSGGGGDTTLRSAGAAAPNAAR